MMTFSEKTLKTVRFGDFTFDKGTGELRKGKDRVHLRPLAVCLLTMLLDNAGSTVKREKLRDELWRDKVVEWETGLHRITKELRTALVDDAREPKFIETVTRRGYRFCAPIKSDGFRGDAQGRIKRVRWFLAGVFAFPGLVLAWCLAIGVTS